MKDIMLILLLSASFVRAGLEWQQKEIKLQVHAAQASADAFFHFKNSGSEAIQIDRIEPGCSCLAPRLSKRIIPPGESGELIIRFDLRDRTGKQRKAAVVSTDDGETVSLHVTTDIPIAYNVVPKMLQWAADSQTTNKTARLLNPNKEPLRLLAVSSSHKGLPAELKTVREGFEYEVLISRTANEQNMRSVIRVTTEPPEGHKTSKTLKLYVLAR